MLRATGVQIPEDNLDDLHSSREEDGTSWKTMVPQRLTSCDPLALVDCITPVEDNIGLLEASILERLSSASAKASSVSGITIGLV
ncbi:hypothetical protein Tco_0595776 [Tanacetum coccineum]